jgi:hypothetical protein
MTPQDAARLKELLREAEEILSRSTDMSQLKTLTDIELETHRRIREHIAPEMMSFLVPRVASAWSRQAHPRRPRPRKIQTTVGLVRLTDYQAATLGVGSHRQFSPLVERFALLAVAKESFEQASRDLGFMCGIHIHASTLQRLVQRASPPLAAADAGPSVLRKQKPRGRGPVVEYVSPEGLPAPRKRGRKPSRYTPVTPSLPETRSVPNPGHVSHVSVDGGKIRLTSSTSQNGTEWRDYKAAVVNGGCPDQERHACLHDNEALADRVRGRPGMDEATFIADGHPGVWNAMALMRPEHFDRASAGANGATLEILDWYHLVENVHKADWTKARKERICDLLWEGKVSQALVNEVKDPHHCLWKYLTTHRQRIVNYKARQEAGLVIGSGAVESTVKLIDARTKLPGAWWNPCNVNAMLNVRTAYVNGWLHNTG